MLAVSVLRVLPSGSPGKTASTGKTWGFWMVRSDAQFRLPYHSKKSERFVFPRATHTQFPQTTFTKDGEGPNFGSLMLRLAFMCVKQYHA